MKKIKRTPIPLPVKPSKSPSKPTHASSKPPLSQEFIASSDESGNEAPPRERKKEKPVKTKATTTIAVHRPKVNGVAKKVEKPTPKPSAAPRKVIKEVREISSSSEDSEDSEDSEEESIRIKTPTQKEGNQQVARDSSESSSGSDSSSDQSDEESVPSTTQNAAPNQSKTPQSHVVDFRPAKAYVPPKDFTAIPTPYNPSQATGMFTNLEGKQIWHIKAPADLPLESVKELAMDKALEGDAILKLNGLEYGFSEQEKNEQSQAVLIPQNRGFTAVPTRITKTLHLQQLIQLPNLAPPTTTPAVTSFITSSTILTPRPQVKGLKMNFFPSGFGPSEPVTIGSSDSEMEVPARAMTNGTIHTSHKREKRKHANEDMRGEREESPMKKHKKHRTPEEIKKREEKKARKEKRKEKAKS